VPLAVAEIENVPMLAKQRIYLRPRLRRAKREHRRERSCELIRPARRPTRRLVVPGRQDEDGHLRRRYAGRAAGFAASDLVEQHVYILIATHGADGDQV
jgi:hypothetical protein